MVQWNYKINVFKILLLKLKFTLKFSTKITLKQETLNQYKYIKSMKIKSRVPKMNYLKLSNKLLNLQNRLKKKKKFKNTNDEKKITSGTKKNIRRKKLFNIYLKNKRKKRRPHKSLIKRNINLQMKLNSFMDQKIKICKKNGILQKEFISILCETRFFISELPCNTILKNLKKMEKSKKNKESDFLIQIQKRTKKKSKKYNFIKINIYNSPKRLKKKEFLNSSLKKQKLAFIDENCILGFIRKKNQNKYKFIITGNKCEYLNINEVLLNLSKKIFFKELLDIKIKSGLGLILGNYSSLKRLKLMDNNLINKITFLNTIIFLTLEKKQNIIHKSYKKSILKIFEKAKLFFRERLKLKK